MTKLGTKWVRNDQIGYEMTKLKIKVGMKLPKRYGITWVRGPGYEMTGYPKYTCIPIQFVAVLDGKWQPHIRTK